MGSISAEFQITDALHSLAGATNDKEQKLRVVVIGFGMAAAHFAKILSASPLQKYIKLTIIGEEPQLAYNRVKLSSYIKHQSPDTLLLQPAEWYAQHGIETITNLAVTSLCRETQTLQLTDDRKLSYDVLIFATGSRAAKPPIEGIHHRGVFFYRTISDLDTLIEYTKGKQRAVVIGAGLLGLEAAEVAKQLNLEVSVIERADFPMPQQLNQPAGDVLRQLIEAQGISLHTSVANTEIHRSEDSNMLSVHLGEDHVLETDLVIVSTGITPNSELAAESGLEVGVRGGLVVNQNLQSSDPRIFAIGECAVVHGRTYGLVSPCQAMAEFLISHWEKSNKQGFPQPDLSTRLKMLHVDVIVFGNVFDQGKSYEYKQQGIYRLLSLSSKGVLLGCLGIGQWEESGHLLTRIQESDIVSKAELKRFLTHGSLLDSTEAPVSAWSASSIICQCNKVTKADILRAIPNCSGCPKQVAESTGASQVCGSCAPLVEELCGLTPQSIGMPKAIRVFLFFSAIALVFTLLILCLPGAPTGDSVESTWYKLSLLWREFLYKQISGYSLLAIFLIGLLLSLRKRIAAFRWGSITAWRIFHAVFGLFALLALFVHTGFHFGKNLNFWLMLTFVLTNVFGGMLGVICSLEFAHGSKLARRARQWKRPMLLLHIMTFWPLPILLTFHILSVYGF